MEKTDLLEIKKLFRYPECSFGKIGFSVISSLEYEGQDPIERVEYTSETKFLTRDDEEQKSFLTLLQKAFCFQEGVSSLDVSVSGDLKKLLSSFAFSEKSGNHAFSAFSELIVSNYYMPKSYALVYFLGGYDIPQKDTSKTKTGESEEVYNYVAVMLCPIEASKVGLSPKDNDIKRGDIVRILKQPLFGLLYPSFTNRSADDDSAFVCCKKEAERSLVNVLFGEDIPEPVKRQKAVIKEAVADAISSPPLDGSAALSDYPESDDIPYRSDESDSASATPLEDYHAREKDYATHSFSDNASVGVNDIDSALLKKRDAASEDIEEPSQKLDIKEDKSVVSNNKVTERDIDGKKFFIIPRDLLPDDILKKILSLAEQQM